MKLVLLTICFALGVLAQDKYESTNDNFDFKEVLTNDRLLKSYVKCLVDKGPCTSEVKKLKGWVPKEVVYDLFATKTSITEPHSNMLPEALETRCAKCTDKQKKMGKVLAHEVKKNHPDIWKQLVAKYDPEGKYQQAWKDFLQE